MAGVPATQLYGTLDVLILKALAWQELHGYALCTWIRERSNGVLDIDDAGMYKALHRLAAQGHVTAAWGVSPGNRRVKFYSITARGRRHLDAEAAQWRRYAAAVFQLLETT